MVRPEGYMIVPAALDGRTVARMNEREQQLATLRRREIGERIKGETIVHMGKPSREIINLAKAKKVDLIIIATHGYTGMKHVLLGSTAERVVRRAPCPVLVVREKENEFISMTQE
jgi:universal stress protein A